MWQLATIGAQNLRRSDFTFAKELQGKFPQLLCDMEHLNGRIAEANAGRDPHSVFCSAGGARLGLGRSIRAY
jgi:hypothetical protein